MSTRIKQATNLIIAIATLLFWLWRGVAKKVINPKRFIIVQPTKNLGDMVCVTPVIAAIKNNVPDAYIVLVGSASNKELFSDGGGVDEYWEAATPILQLIQRVRKGRFDAGIAINIDSGHLSTLFLGNVQGISCFTMCPKYYSAQPRAYNLIAWLAFLTEYYPGQYIPDQYVKLLKPFGIQNKTATKKLSVHSEALSRVNSALQLLGIDQRDKVVAIAPGAGSDLKRWPVERFAAIADWIYQVFGLPIVLVGGVKDQTILKGMMDGMDPETRYWHPGPQSLQDLKATLSRAMLVIGNDSGAIHVGEAVGAMTLTIAGATDVVEHMQESITHRIVKGNIVGPQYRAYIVNEEHMDPNLARRQMESVSIESVMNNITQMIIDKNNPPVANENFTVLLQAN